MSLVKRGQTSTRINSASGIQSHITVGGDATGGLLWGNLGNLGVLGSESCRTAALRDTPNTMARVKGEESKLTACTRRLSFCHRTAAKSQEVSWERNRAAAEHRVTWNSIPPDPVCTIQENKPRSETEKIGAAKNSQPRKSCCIQILEKRLLLGNSTGRVDQLSTKRLCCMNFRNGLKKWESSVIDTHYIGRTDFWNEEKSTYGSHSFPSLTCSPAPRWPTLVD